MLAAKSSDCRGWALLKHHGASQGLVWRAGRTAAEALAVDMCEIKDGVTADTVAALQILDNVACYAVTYEDTLIPCRKG